MESHSEHLPRAEYLEFLDSVSKGWYVETSPLLSREVQGGYVTKVIRDRCGVPVCLKVKIGRRKDIISVDRVAFYEVYFPALPYCVDYGALAEQHERLLSNGYVLDSERFIYLHPETGDEVSGDSVWQ